MHREIDFDNSAEITQAVRETVARRRPARVRVDLGELTFLDSPGLMVLLNGLRRVMRQGGRLAIACTNPTVLRLFEITGTESTFTIVDSRDAALAYVREDGSEPS